MVQAPGDSLVLDALGFEAVGIGAMLPMIRTPPQSQQYLALGG